jgi:signal transduction histidine kinase
LEIKGQLVGKLYRDVIPAGMPPDANALRSLDSGTASQGMNKNIDLPSGVRLSIAVSTSVLRDEKGEVCGAVEVFQDLSRIRRMESELARLNTLAALGEMAASVAHEVRNPLAGIAGFVMLLERDLEDGDPKKRIVDKIMLGVNNLNETVTSLLNYTRFDELNPADVVYHDYIRGVIEQFEREFPQRDGKVDIRLSPVTREEQSTTVSIDRLLIRQIFFNLFGNGADAMGGNGTITITLTRHDLKQVPVALAERLLLKADETLLETRIADSGPGIPAENLEKIFSPFFSTKKNGNGLGLAVGQKIARAHGGEILAENSPEGGAVFRLFLPVRIQHQGRE